MADGAGRSGQPEDGRGDPRAASTDGVSLGKGGQEQRSGPQEPPRPTAEQPTMTSPAAAGPPPVPPAPGSPYGQQPAQQSGQQPGQQPGHQPGQQAAQQYGGAYPYGQQPPAQGQSASASPQPAPYPGHGAGYGYPSPPSAYGYGAGYAWGQPLPTGKSVAAMVLGIVGLVLVALCWTSFVAIIVSPIALGLGLSARRQADRGEIGGRGQAVAGFVMGIVGTILAAIVVAVLIVTIVLAAKDDQSPGGGYGDGSSLDARRPAATAPAGG